MFSATGARSLASARASGSTDSSAIAPGQISCRRCQASSAVGRRPATSLSACACWSASHSSIASSLRSRSSAGSPTSASRLVDHAGADRQRLLQGAEHRGAGGLRVVAGLDHRADDPRGDAGGLGVERVQAGREQRQRLARLGGRRAAHRLAEGLDEPLGAAVGPGVAAERGEQLAGGGDKVGRHARDSRRIARAAAILEQAWPTFPPPATCCAPRTSPTRATSIRSASTTWPPRPACRARTSAASSGAPSARRRARTCSRAASSARRRCCARPIARSRTSACRSASSARARSRRASRACTACRRRPTARRYPPAADHARVPACLVHFYGRPQRRTFREDSEPAPD